MTLFTREWGTSIYGAVDRADAPWFLTHAYDLGATRFFFWDYAGLACVPYQECLSLARQLKMRHQNRPEREREQLRRAAEVVILLPPGLKPQVPTTGGRFEVTLEFGLNRPGKYRLRAAAVDLAGRSTVR